MVPKAGGVCCVRSRILDAGANKSAKPPDIFHGELLVDSARTACGELVED